MENGTLSPILLETSLPYIDHRSCRNIYSNGFKIFMPYDKFCASFTLGNKIFNYQHHVTIVFFPTNLHN